jgi:DUF1009 family protein
MAVLGQGGNQSDEGRGPLAIICGGGSLPFAVADAVQTRGRQIVLFPLRESADAHSVAAYRHHWMHLGQIGRFCRLARQEGCRDIVLIGALVRPAVWQLRPDLRTLLLLPRIISFFRGGDDYLLSRVATLLGEQGFRLLGAHEVAPEILMPEGVLGSHRPRAGDNDDIAYGLEFLRAAGAFDVGQAAVIAGRHILAVEAAEGTDQMLARVAELRASGRIRSQGGVLVKAPKPGQDRRIDLPAIGPQTAEGAARAGLLGIAVIAGDSIVAEAERMRQTADRNRIFVMGVPKDGSSR